MAQDVAESAGADQVLDLAAMPRAFGDEDLRGPFPLAQFDDSRDDIGVRIDDLVAVVFDQVRLSTTRLPASGTRDRNASYCRRTTPARSAW